MQVEQFGENDDHTILDVYAVRDWLEESGYEVFYSAYGVTTRHKGQPIFDLTRSPCLGDYECCDDVIAGGDFYLTVGVNAALRHRRKRTKHFRVLFDKIVTREGSVIIEALNENEAGFIFDRLVDEGKLEQEASCYLREPEVTEYETYWVDIDDFLQQE